MKSKTMSLIGAATALAAGPALAAPAFEGPAVPVAASYADLLTPISNAQERLRAADMEEQVAQAQPELIQAQYHHHHHHHQNHNRRWYLSHGYYWFNGGWTLRPRHPHHHHHHHHHA
jgi:hypothetical protein